MGSEREVLSPPTDQPGTPNLDTLRKKRLQFFSKKHRVGNSSLASKSTAAHADVPSNKLVSASIRSVSQDPLQGEPELDPLLLQDSGVPEHQKLRHVLAWAQNFIKTGPPEGHGRVSPTNTDHVTLTNSKVLPPRQVLKSPQMCFSSQACALSRPHPELHPLPRPLDQLYHEPHPQPRLLSQPHPEPHPLDQPCPEPHPQSRPLDRPGLSVYETYLMCVSRLSWGESQGCKEAQDHKEVQLSCRETPDHKEAKLSCRETRDCKEALVSESVSRQRSQCIDTSENRHMDLTGGGVDFSITNCGRGEGRRALEACAYSPLSTLEEMHPNSVTPLITTTEHTTTELTANTPAYHATIELAANTPPNHTNAELAANAPSYHTTTELTANTPAYHTIMELTANTPAYLTTKEQTASTPCDYTTAELATYTPADHTNAVVTANAPAGHTRTELPANIPADHTRTELPANSTTAERPAPAPAEGPGRETHSGVADRCCRSADKGKRRAVEGKKPTGSWPRRGVSSGSSRRRRFWEKSSMLWSSYPEGTLLPRMKPSTRPASTFSSVADCTPQDSTHSLDSSGPRGSALPETPQHRKPEGTVFEGWLSLPDELWMAILKLLTHSDLCHVAQTCHRLCRLANDSSLWQVVRIENSQCLNVDWLRSIGKRGPCSLTLYRCTDKHVTPRGLEELFAQSGGSLRELIIVSCSGPGLHGDKLLLPCSRYCPQLTNVDVSWTGATDTGLAALASATSSLETLVVNGCSITDSVFKCIIKQHGGSLRRLEVFGCRSLSPACLSAMPKACPHLKAVNLGKLPKMTEACLTFIVGRLKQLTSLDLTGLAVVRDRTVHLISRQCPELQDLTLRCCPAVTDRSLTEISTYSASIRYLDVSGCSAVTDVGVQAISMACQRLQYLDLSSTKTSNKGVRLLASYGSRHLHTVKISFCFICQDSLRKLCRHCPGLRLLHLYGACDFHNVAELRLINPRMEAKCDGTCVTPPGQPN